MGICFADNLNRYSSEGFNWPALLFWIVALGGPFLIYKCVSQLVKAAEESRRWATGDGEHYIAQVLLPQLYTFEKLYYSLSKILRDSKVIITVGVVIYF